jgi:hypothetical protein
MILRRNSKVGAALNPNSAPPAHITPLACVPSSLEVRKKNIHNKIAQNPNPKSEHQIHIRDQNYTQHAFCPVSASPTLSARRICNL